MRCKAEQRNEKQSGNAYGICEKCRCLLRCRKGGVFFEYFAVFSYHTVYVYGDSNARNRVERPKSSVLYGVFACGGILMFLSECPQASAHKFAYSFTEPRVMPVVIFLEETKYRILTGKLAQTDVAKTLPHANMSPTI